MKQEFKTPIKDRPCKESFIRITSGQYEPQYAQLCVIHTFTCWPGIYVLHFPDISPMAGVVLMCTKCCASFCPSFQHAVLDIL